MAQSCLLCWRICRRPGRKKCAAHTFRPNSFPTPFGFFRESVLLRPFMTPIHRYPPSARTITPPLICFTGLTPHFRYSTSGLEAAGSEMCQILGLGLQDSLDSTICSLKEGWKHTGRNIMGTSCHHHTLQFVLACDRGIEIIPAVSRFCDA